MTYKYYMPARIISGADCITNNSGLFKTLGKKALIVTGADSAKMNGSMKDVISALESECIPYALYDRVASNPTVSCAYEGADYAKDNGADFVIAIGGGSTMDAGKAIALLTVQEINESDLFSGLYENKVMPMAFVPTTAGTGSEVTQYSILTNDRAQTKTSIATELLFPDLVFLDPKYTKALPVKTTVNTVMDALSHAVEGMLSVKGSFLSNALAAESLRLIRECMPQLLNAAEQTKKTAERPEALISVYTREKLLQASLMAGMVIAQTGTTAVHAMGYSLTYFKNIDHGRANGLLLAGYLKLVEKVQPELTARILSLIGFSDIGQFKELTDRLFGEKEKISEYEFKKYSGMAMKTKNIANCIVTPTENDLTAVFLESFN